MHVEAVSSEGRPPALGEGAGRPFVDAARRGRLVLPWCPSCGSFGHPGNNVCATCWAHTTVWRRASGRGVVMSFVVFRRGFHSACPAPYNVAVVELEEGPRLTAEVVGIPDELLYVGMSVVATYPHAVDPGAPPVHFRPARPSTATPLIDRGGA